MTRSYGTLRSGGGRRSGSAAWQWIVIGFVFGFACTAVIALALVYGVASGAFGGDAANFLVAGRPTQTPMIITATPLPVTNTPIPTEILVTATLTPTVAQVVVLAPTATPTTDPASIQVQSSPTPTPQATEAVQAQPQALTNNTAANPTSDIPPALAGILSPMQSVTGGTFQMGTTAQEVAAAVTQCTNEFEGNCQLTFGEDSSPPHNVTIDPFQMETTEVSYAQFIAFLNSMGPNSHRTGCDGQICAATRAEEQNSNIIFDSANYRVNPVVDSFPVTSVTWYGAKKYCETIGRRLPTEAEWERAARGQNNVIYPWGDTFDVTLANTSRPKVDPAVDGAEAVTSYPAGASGFGMLNMAGNVAEWVSDWYAPTYYTQQAQSATAVLNPTGPVAGTEKVVRGGSWDAVPFFSRSVHRQSNDPAGQTLWLGFRCAADAPTGQTAGQPAGTTNTQPNALSTLPPSSGNEEDTANSQPTVPPPPATSAPLNTGAPTATLSPNG